MISRPLFEGLEGFAMAVALDFDAVLVPVAPRVSDAAAFRKAGVRRMAPVGLACPMTLGCLVVRVGLLIASIYVQASSLGFSFAKS